jgi:hypothetical protein
VGLPAPAPAALPVVAAALNPSVTDIATDVHAPVPPPNATDMVATDWAMQAPEAAVAIRIEKRMFLPETFEKLYTLISWFIRWKS